MRNRGELLAVGVLCALFSIGHREAHAASGKTGVFVHEAGGKGNRVFVYELTESQKLRPVPGSPFVAGPGGNPIAVNIDAFTVAYSSRESMLFTAGNEGITAWKVQSNLALQKVQGSPFGGGVILTVTVARQGDKTFVYGSAGYPGKGLRGFEVQSDGTLDEVPGSPFEPTGGTFSAPRVVGDRLIVVKAGEFDPTRNGALATFSIQNDGSLTAGPRLPYDQDAFHPFTVRDRCVYLPEINNRRLRTFEMDPATGALVEDPNSPTPIDPELAGTVASGGIVGMATRRDLAFLFTERTSGPAKLQAYRVNADCSLRPLGGIQNLGTVIPVVATVNGRLGSFVIADPGQVRAFQFNPKTGRFTTKSTKGLGAGNLTGITVGTVNRVAPARTAAEDED